MNDNCQLVVFTNKAYNAIIRECFDKDPLETGGILLGHVLDNGVWIVMEVLPPGINSVFQQAYFEYDEAFVNYLAQSVANQYRRPLDLLGLWHRHPGSMDVFSSTDDGTNATFARQNPAGVISGLVNIDPRFRLTMYHLDRPAGRIIGRPKYEVVDVEVGDDIIPEEYFELRYYNGGEVNLQPMVATSGYERNINHRLHDTYTDESSVIDSVCDCSTKEENSEGIETHVAVNSRPSQSNTYGNVTPKVVNDFFYFWKSSKKKWLYILLGILSVIIVIFSIKSCKETAKGVFSWISTNYEKDNINTEDDTIPTLSEKSLSFAKIGESKNLIVKNISKNVVWASSNPEVAKVKDGKVTAVSEGRAIISAKTGDKLIGECVIDIDINDVSSDPVEEKYSAGITEREKALVDTTKTWGKSKTGTLNVNESFKLPLVIMGCPAIIFESTDPKVATIDTIGNITAIKKGKAIIKILSNGEITDKFELKVN